MNLPFPNLWTTPIIVVSCELFHAAFYPCSGTHECLKSIYTNAIILHTALSLASQITLHIKSCYISAYSNLLHFL